VFFVMNEHQKFLLWWQLIALAVAIPISWAILQPAIPPSQPRPGIGGH
jgi:hypothetical protein